MKKQSNPVVSIAWHARCAALVLLLGLSAAAMAADPYTFRHLAGGWDGEPPQDGPVAAARIGPLRAVVDPSGFIYFLEGNALRRIDATGAIATVAGRSDLSGSADGREGGARFFLPRGLALESSGDVVVVDSYNHTIRRVTPDGIVTTIAGAPGSVGYADGPALAARFSFPTGIAVGATGEILVVEQNNHTLRRIAGGMVSTVAGVGGSSGDIDGLGPAARFRGPQALAIAPSGDVYVADTGNDTLRKVTPLGDVTTVAGIHTCSVTGPLGNSLCSPNGVAVDAAGNVYIAVPGDWVVRKLDPLGTLTTLAGTPHVSGHRDGPGATALFTRPYDVTVDGAGRVLVADGRTLRAIAANGDVTTAFGVESVPGSDDGVGAAARFNRPAGIARAPDGTLYVTDSENHTIRKVTPLGVVTTLAGDPCCAGSADGNGASARFTLPNGIAVDPSSGDLFVTDGADHTLRRITPAGDVTTLAGLAGSFGWSDGLGSAGRFNGPTAVAVDDVGDLYVADRGNHTIRRVTAAGLVTTIAGRPRVTGYVNGYGTDARFHHPVGLAIDSAGELWVADSSNDIVRRVTRDGWVTTGAGCGNWIRTPRGIAVDSNGNVFVDTSTGRLVRVAPDGMIVDIADHYHSQGALAAGPAGELYVADVINSTLFVAQPAIADDAIIDQPSGAIGDPRQLDVTPRTATFYEWRVVSRPVDSIATLSDPTAANPTFTPDIAGNYRFEARASGPAGSSRSSVDLNTGCAPTIVASPRDVTSNLGSRVVLSVMANGAGPLAYQWIWNGNSKGGVAADEVIDTLWFGGRSAACDVSNACGVATSRSARITADIAIDPAGNDLRLVRVGQGSGLFFVEVSWQLPAGATEGDLHWSLDKDFRSLGSLSGLSSSPVWVQLPVDPLIYLRIAGTNSCGDGPLGP